MKVEVTGWSPLLFFTIIFYNASNMEDQNIIRVKVLAWLQSGDSLFVVKMHDSEKGDDYYRPIGGKVEFGETTRAALLREVSEELGTSINIIGEPLILENLFTCNGNRGHEIDYVYPSQFDDPAFNRRRIFALIEADGTHYDAAWIPLRAFTDHELRLVPEALLEWCGSGA